MLQNRRKIIVTNPRFQFKFLILLNIILLILLSFYPLLLTSLMDHLVTMHYISAANKSSLLKALLGYFVLVQVVLHFIFSVFVIFISHRVAGPVEKIKLALESYLDGKIIENTGLRSSDYFEEISPLLDRLNQELKNKQKQAESK